MQDSSSYPLDQFTTIRVQGACQPSLCSLTYCQIESYDLKDRMKQRCGMSSLGDTDEREGGGRNVGSASDSSLIVLELNVRLI